MIKHIIILGLVFLPLITFTTIPDFNSSFDKINSRFADIHKEIETMVTEMFNDSMQQTKISKNNIDMPSIAQNEKTIAVSMKAPKIDHEKIEIKKIPHINGEYLNIIIPIDAYIVKMTITPYEITYSSKQKIEEEKTKDDNKATNIYYSYDSSTLYQSLPCEVHLDDVKAEYENDTLTITLQKVAPKKNVQTIPVIKK